MDKIKHLGSRMKGEKSLNNQGNDKGQLSAIGLSKKKRFMFCLL